MKPLSCVAMVLALGAALLAQEPVAAPDRLSPGEKLLAEIDERIHYARTAGLRDLQVDWKIEGQGYLAPVLSQYALRYSWMSPDHWLVGVLTADREPVTELPDVFKSEEGSTALQRLSTSLHQSVQQLMIGAPLAHLYRDYTVELRSKTVNDEIQHTLTMRPKSKKAFTEISVRVVRGLPREFRKLTEEGATVAHQYRYEERDGKWLVTGMKVLANNRVELEESYEYVKVRGFYLVARVERMLGKDATEKLATTPRQIVRFENHVVNQGLPPSLFGLEEDPEEPEPKVETSPGKDEKTPPTPPRPIPEDAGEDG